MDLAGIKDPLLLVRKILLYKKYELPMNQKREVWTKNNLVMFAELVEYRVSFLFFFFFFLGSLWNFFWNSILQALIHKNKYLLMQLMQKKLKMELK